MKVNNIVELKPYSLQELSRLYKVSPKTIKRWLRPFEEELGMRNGRYYTIQQVKVIFNRLGLPSVIHC